ncbi:MAG: hypothetical protein HFJ38_08720 [Bacilli bacterium]|nr:hypothetical protein [Bacilli bacterium]
MNKKNKFLIIFFLSLNLILIELINPAVCFAADPTLINKLKGAFEKIESYIMKLATPIAAIAIGSGALMKKFSFGDEEKIRTGRNLIKGSLFSYGFVLCTDMILSLINTLVG